MSEPDLDEMAPVDYLVVEFPVGESNFNGEMAAALAALADSGTIRVLDLLILQKDADGSVEAMEIDDLDGVDELRALETEIAEILAEKYRPTPRFHGTGQRRGCPRGERLGCTVRCRPHGAPEANMRAAGSPSGDRRLDRSRTERRSLRCRCDQHEPCDAGRRRPLATLPPPSVLPQSSPRRRPTP
jgi:hypothetical protein